MQLPSLLLQAVKGLYDGDSYVLVDGNDRSAPVMPNKGVKQGCPLSPLLFALYVNDIAPYFATAGEGVLHASGMPVTHVMYAGDLTQAN